MKIVIHATSKPLHQGRAQIFLRGLEKHGLTAIITTASKPIPCDLAVFWSNIRNYPGVVAQQQINKKDYLNAETPCLKTDNKWFSLGYNGFAGRADFLNQNSPSDRWDKYFNTLLKDWKSDGKYILITGQVTGDTALHPVDGKVDYQKIVDELKKITTRKIVYRRHPHKTRPTAQCPIGAKPSTGSLDEDLLGAYCVVTFNSLSSVDAILSGTPCIVLDKGAMAWDVCGHSLLQVNNPPKPDRTQWCYDTAYTQWTLEEIENGDAWEHLKNKYK